MPRSGKRIGEQRAVQRHRRTGDDQRTGNAAFIISVFETQSAQDRVGIGPVYPEGRLNIGHPVPNGHIGLVGIGRLDIDDPPVGREQPTGADTAGLIGNPTA